MRTVSLYNFLKYGITIVLLFILKISYAEKYEIIDTAKLKVNASFEIFCNTKVPVVTFKNLLTKNAAIKVKDQKGNEYEVVSFEVMWKRKDISDDDKTGTPKVIYYNVGETMKGNQFNKQWLNELAKSLQPGEEIYFSTILYFDPKKKSNYKAPSFSIYIN